jgi:hypothetical protein
VTVLKDWKRRLAIQEPAAASWRIIFVAVHSLEHVPAIILSSAARCRLKVDFFPGTLTHVGDEKITSHTVKGETPGIAHAVRPNLVQRVRVAHERIVRRHRVVAIRVAGEIVTVNIHTQDLAQPGLEILGVLLRVAAAAAITQPDVKVAIRTESKLSAVVVRKRLRLSQDRVSRAWIGDVWVLGGDCVASDLRSTVYVRVIDVEKSVSDVVRVKRETQ